jgi:hypothetical protein
MQERMSYLHPEEVSAPVVQLPECESVAGGSRTQAHTKSP